MTDQHQNDRPFLPNLFPYLISEMDQYYGVKKPFGGKVIEREQNYSPQWHS